MFGHTLHRSYMAMCVFCSTLLNFVFAGRLGINPMDPRYQPYGPWPHVLEFVWAHEEATIEEEENDDGVCCQLCGHRLGDISECGTCHLNILHAPT